MKYCYGCQKVVNTNRKMVHIGIADVWNEHCSECGTFLESGFDHTDLVVPMGPEEPTLKWSHVIKIVKELKKEKNV